MSLTYVREIMKKIDEEIEGTLHCALEMNGEQVLINADKKIPAASLVKLPILIETLHQCQMGKLSLTDKVPIEQKIGGAGVISSLEGVHSLTIRDVITLMIIVSDNTAANIILKQLGFPSIYNMCETLGCRNTHMERYFMDFQKVKERSDNFTSAIDMITFLKQLYNGSYLNTESKEMAINILKNQQFNHKLPAYSNRYPVSGFFIAHKTGELPGAEHDAGIIEGNRKKALISISVIGLKNNVEGQQAIASIGSHLFSYLRNGW